ncbi:MAG: hypothetical protein UE783_04645 [Prevotella sp.]|nr:hypothetical protein [Prevotella sp.]
MKRFFTFLMAVWALLSISQTVKADDVTVYFQCPKDWRTPVCAYAYNSDDDHVSDWFHAPAGSEYYTSTGVKLWKCTFDSKYKYVIFKEPADGDKKVKQYPDGQGFVVKDNHVYTSTPTGDMGTLSEFEKKAPYTYTLIGGYGNGSWTIESSNFVYDGVGKYTYTFTATQTGEFRFRLNTSYTSGAALCPNVDAEAKRKELTSASDAVTYTDQKDASGKLMSDNYWFCNVTNGKKYTFTLTEKYNSTDKSYTRNLSVVPEEAVVTKVIKLLNGTSELTGSNGKYTLDLSGETSSDANITLTINGAKYGLATAQAISTVGTTDVDFVANAPAALTLTKGFIYSLSVTEDGKMTVVAKEKGVADGNYYLVGNFFEEDLDKINYDKKYFRFTNSKGDGTLTFDIPASLAIKAQVYASDGTCYGPVTDNGKTFLEISKTKPTADAKSVDGKLVAGSNYWTFTERGLDETGIYTITITVDAAGTPTKWDVTYDKSKRMAYFLVDPTKDPDAVVHPAYAVVKEDRSCNNNFYGNIYLEAGQHCFVVGNLINGYNDDVTGHPVKTTKKLYLQGNGGLDPTTDVAGSEKAQYTNVLPNKDGFTYNETKLMLLEYNPTRGNGDDAQRPENHGICGEILKSSSQITDEPITSVQIVGDGVVGSWNLEDAKDMTYNNKLDCWEYTFKTDKSESADNKFRFIANRDWKYNWGEDSTEPSKLARTPYTDTTKPGLEASLKEPNELGFTKNGTERGGDGTYGDMIFNRPAGEWTIRLYTRTLNKEDGSGYVARHAYTITGSESKDIYLTYRKDRFIRTYSNNKPMNPDNDNVKIYEVYQYVKPEGGNADNIYARGTVYLRRLKYVPANVGVVLIGEAPAGGPYTDGQKVAFSLLERTEKSVEPGGDYREVWTKSNDYIAANDQWNNYLVPTVTAVNDLGNAKVESGKITYRYFGLGNYYSTNYHKSLGDKDTQEDYIGFFRFTANGKSGANKAYLSIPANAEVGNRVGATYGFIDYNGQLLGNEDGDNESIMPAQFAKMALVFDDLVDGNEVTGIKELETENLNNDKYYNLQGIEVAYPVKGIYIHNGKKVIVK